MPHVYWTDNLNPWIVHFGGDFGIKWYGVAYMLGFFSAFLIWNRWARKGLLPLNADDLLALLTYAIVGVMVGGRLGYCLLYNLDEVRQNPLEILAVWHGGMASHGGIAGLICAIWVFARVRELNPWTILDAAAAVGPLGIAFGRIANFINGELWGRPSTVPWAVIFPDAPLVNGVEVPRHPSQLYAAGIEGIVLLFVAQWMFHRQSRPGMTTAVVCIAYGVGRFIDEFWREPDVGQPVFWGWMSKGQLLTIPMILCGVALWIWRSSADDRKHQITEDAQES